MIIIIEMMKSCIGTCWFRAFVIWSPWKHIFTGVGSSEVWIQIRTDILKLYWDGQFERIQCSCC